MFQNLDRVIFVDSKNNLIADTDTLDLDPRSFSQRLDVVEFENIKKENRIDMPPAVGTGCLCVFLKLGLSINNFFFKKNFSNT